MNNLNKSDIETIKNIVKLSRIESPKLFAFGSRVTGSNKEYSDLDLIIDSPTPMSLEQRAVLNENFQNSNLLFRVDFHDKNFMHFDLPKEAVVI
jgi:predicted nucleotidyltransferase